MACVALEGVWKTYAGGVVALRDFHLRARSGELLALLGPSGGGKSTVLRLLAGLERPCRGGTRLDDQPLDGVPPRRRDVAMLFQQPALYPHLSVFENLAFPLRARRPHAWRAAWLKWPFCKQAPAASDAPTIRSRVEQAAEWAGASDLLGRYPHQLSGGQRQRVALGRALARSPKLLLLDEPLSHLDAQARWELRGEIRRAHQRLGVTTLHVTHDQDEALALGDRVAVLHQGRLRQIGSPREVYEQPADKFVAGFVGAPPMNFVAGRLLAEENAVVFRGPGWGWRVADSAARLARWPAWREALQRGAAGLEVTWGLRPDDWLAPPGAADPPALGSPPALCETARVAATEGVGRNRWALLEAGDTRLRARVPPGQEWPPGGEPPLAFAPERGHFFDAATERNLSRPENRIE